MDAASEYFRDLPEILSEMDDLGTIDGVVTYALGMSAGGAGSVPAPQPIRAIQFGPLQVTPRRAPTLLITATLHANEWEGTAVAQHAMRHLAETVRNPDFDPALREVLTEAAVVIVPVANPDGYWRTRNVPTDTARRHRGNLNMGGCVFGVDLNRNFPIAWEETPDTCGGPSGSYPGPGPASENETRALLRALDGGELVPGARAVDVVALLDYHGALGQARVTNGYHAVTDGDGPRCGASEMAFCANADYPLFHRVFGDPTSTGWSQTPIGDEPMPVEHSWLVGSRIGGTLRLDAEHGDRRRRALGLLVELPAGRWARRYECYTDAEVAELAQHQIDVIRQAAGQLVALGLARRDDYSALPLMGQAAREFGESFGPADASRMAWLHSAPRGAALPLTIELPEGDKELTPRRTGPFHDLHAYDPLVHGRSPLDWPCCFGVRDAEGARLGDVCFTACGANRLDLCDPDRLEATGWELREEERSGRLDCYWTPTAADGEIVLPADLLPAGVEWRNCYANLSVAADDVLPYAALVFERERLGPGGEPSGEYERLLALELDGIASQTTGFGADPAAHSFNYPIALLPGATPSVPSFRLRTAGLGPGLLDGRLRVSDLTIACIGDPPE